MTTYFVLVDVLEHRLHTISEGNPCNKCTRPTAASALESPTSVLASGYSVRLLRSHWRKPRLCKPFWGPERGSHCTGKPASHSLSGCIFLFSFPLPLSLFYFMCVCYFLRRAGDDSPVRGDCAHSADTPINLATKKLILSFAYKHFLCSLLITFDPLIYGLLWELLIVYIGFPYYFNYEG